jgi:hypothetical protein
MLSSRPGTLGRERNHALVSAAAAASKRHATSGTSTSPKLSVPLSSGMSPVGAAPVCAPTRARGRLEPANSSPRFSCHGETHSQRWTHRPSRFSLCPRVSPARPGLRRPVPAGAHSSSPHRWRRASATFGRFENGTRRNSTRGTLRPGSRRSPKTSRPKPRTFVAGRA